ncbi:MAG: aldolase/citrate lyase family protein [Chloroflexi bacterium]|nr:aldolase/citrate lyase family protein [Chloroflexota bacterium]
MGPNTVKRHWAEGRPALGARLWSASPIVAEQMAHAGFDWLYVDGEHSPADILAIVRMIRVIAATGTIPIARAPWNDPAEVKRVLDGGARGVIIPWVNTAAEAERAVAACRYPPRGIRRGGSDDPAKADDEIACIVQIETIGAVERIDEILSVPGVDATFIGQSDLAVSMGVPVVGDNRHPDHVAACAEVLAGALRHGVAPGIGCSGEEEAARRVSEGWKFIGIGADGQYIARGARRALAMVRAAGS